MNSMNDASTHTLGKAHTALSSNERGAAKMDASILPDDKTRSLYDAVRVVAATLGVCLQPPDDLLQDVPIFQRLHQLCDSSGIYVRKVRLRRDWWRHDNGPLIAFFRNVDGGEPQRDLHPAALVPVSATSYHWIDPLSQHPRVLDAQLAKGFHEEAYMLYSASREPLPGTRQLLGPIIRRHWRELLGVLLMALAGGLMNMLVPVISGMIYGNVIPNAYSAELKQLVLILFAAALGACSFQLTRAYTVLHLTGKFDLRLQPLVWGRLLALPVSFFRHFTIGDLAERVQGIRTIRQLLLTDVTTAVLSLLTSITSFALLFFYSWRLAFLAAGLIICLMSAALMAAMFQLRHRRRFLELQGRISSLSFGLVQGISKLRSCGAEKRAYGVWGGLLAEQSLHTRWSHRVAAWQSGFNAFYLVASELALFGLMGFALRNHLSVAHFLAFSAAFGQIQMALLTFISVTPELFTIIPVYKRLQPILSRAAEADRLSTRARLTGAIEVCNVSFRYGDQGPLVLDNISLNARPGEFIAIVGPSGSGKSTLIRLLLGFESPNSGSILYDGQNLTFLDIKSVRRQIGTVLQNSKPVTGDILSNITGSASSDLDAAWRAARIAGIDEEIKTMPMGMHTIIGEGGTCFSGGERQRLMIARAVVNSPRILLLDEATSALDNPAQEKVQRCLGQINATRVVVAHRLSTVRYADCIYVLNAGRIIDKGSYEELWNRHGYFAEMIGRQI